MNQRESTFGDWKIYSETGLMDGTCEMVTFSYTAGLGKIGHPELLVAGLDEALSFDLLDMLARQVMRGVRFDPGEQLKQGVFEGFMAETRPVCAHYLHLLDGAKPLAGGMKSLANAGAVQIVWPDSEGLFPWDRGHSETGQPLFALPADHVWI